MLKVHLKFRTIEDLRNLKHFQEIPWENVALRKRGEALRKCLKILKILKILKLCFDGCQSDCQRRSPGPFYDTDCGRQGITKSFLKCKKSEQDNSCIRRCDNAPASLEDRQRLCALTSECFGSIIHMTCWRKKSMFHTLFIGKQKPTWRIYAFFGNRGAYFDNWRTTFLIPLVFGRAAAVFQISECIGSIIHMTVIETQSLVWAEHSFVSFSSQWWNVGRLSWNAYFATKMHWAKRK